MKLFKIISILLLTFVITACGTYTPIPTHGGGKRFSVEQALVSASMRKAINDIPLTDLKGKKVSVEITVISDSGGGYKNGGRPYINNTASAVSQNISGNTTKIIGSGFQGVDFSYVKDLSLNQSDARQFQSLLLSNLLRNNITINSSEQDGPSEYILEVFVDVLGTWSSQTNWLISNEEALIATTSLEYFIVKLNSSDINKADNIIERSVGRISYNAEYREKYSFWIGPYESNIKIVKGDFLESVQPNPNTGSGSTDAFIRGIKKMEPLPEKQEAPVLISPPLKK